MTLKEFKRYVAIHGANLDRWPPRLVPEALALLDGSEDARRELADAATTDRLLDAATAPQLSAEREERLHARILDRIGERRAPGLTPWFLAKPPLRVAPTAGFLAMMGVLGFLTHNQDLVPFQRANALDLPGAMIVVGYLGETR